MNYKQLQRLNEIIEVLKANPNSDENIQFVLDLADNSVQSETLESLIEEGKLVSLQKTEEQPKVENSTLNDKKQGFVEFTKQEMKQMPKEIRKLILIDKRRFACALIQADATRLHTRFVFVREDTTYPLAVKRLNLQNQICSQN